MTASRPKEEGPTSHGSERTDPDGVPEISLAYQFAHDVRSPIAAVVALSGSLLEDLEGEVSPYRLRQLQLIYNAALHMEGMVGDLTDLGRSDGELLDHRPVVFSIRDLLEDVRDVLDPAAAIQDTRIDVHCPVDGIRRGAASVVCRVLVDLGGLSLRNGPAEELRFTGEPVDDDRVRFAVEFGEPFLDAPAVRVVRDVALGCRSRDRRCFSMLSLELAFRLVDLMGSDLEFETDGSDVTRFTFVLPLSAVPD